MVGPAIYSQIRIIIPMSHHELGCSDPRPTSCTQPVGPAGRGSKRRRWTRAVGAGTRTRQPAGQHLHPRPVSGEGVPRWWLESGGWANQTIYYQIEWCTHSVVLDSRSSSLSFARTWFCNDRGEQSQSQCPSGQRGLPAPTRCSLQPPTSTATATRRDHPLAAPSGPSCAALLVALWCHREALWCAAQLHTAHRHTGSDPRPRP